MINLHGIARYRESRRLFFYETYVRQSGHMLPDENRGCIVHTKTASAMFILYACVLIRNHGIFFDPGTILVET